MHVDLLVLVELLVVALVVSGRCEQHRCKVPAFAVSFDSFSLIFAFFGPCAFPFWRETSQDTS